jgi:hypothetical protein
MPKPVDRSPESASGDWYIDTHYIALVERM